MAGTLQYVWRLARTLRMLKRWNVHSRCRKVIWQEVRSAQLAQGQGEKGIGKFWEEVYMKATRQLKSLKGAWWLVSNWGHPWAVFPRRGQAIAFAREKFYQNQIADQKDWKEVFEIHKVRLEAVRDGK